MSKDQSNEQASLAEQTSVPKPLYLARHVIGVAIVLLFQNPNRYRDGGFFMTWGVSVGLVH